MGDERRDDPARLLAHIRNVAAVVVLGLFVFAVLADRDASTLGMLSGALVVLLGVVSYEAVVKR